jgi:hypothetical protein
MLHLATALAVILSAPAKHADIDSHLSALDAHLGAKIEDAKETGEKHVKAQQIAEIRRNTANARININQMNIDTRHMMEPVVGSIFWSETYGDGQNIQSCGLEDETPSGGATFTDGANFCRPGSGVDGYIHSTIGTWAMGFNGDDRANIKQAPRRVINGPNPTGVPARASKDDFGSWFAYTAQTKPDNPRLAFVKVIGRSCLSYNVDYYSDVLGNFDVYVDNDPCPANMEGRFGALNAASFRDYVAASGAVLIAENRESTHTASCSNRGNTLVRGAAGIPNSAGHDIVPEVTAINTLEANGAVNWAWWAEYNVNNVGPCPSAPGRVCQTIPPSLSNQYCISVVQKPGINFGTYTPYRSVVEAESTPVNAKARAAFATISPATVEAKLANFAFAGPEDGRYVRVDGTDLDQPITYVDGLNGEEKENAPRWLVLAEVQAYPITDEKRCTEWTWKCKVPEIWVCDGIEPPTPILGLPCDRPAPDPIDIGGTCGSKRPECGESCGVPCTKKKVCPEWVYECEQSVPQCTTCPGGRPNVPPPPPNKPTNPAPGGTGGGIGALPTDQGTPFNCPGISPPQASHCDVRYPQACTASGAATFGSVTDAAAFSDCYKSHCGITCQNS